MKTPKEIYDPLYEVYRNLENKPAIPLDAKPLIWKAMQAYSDQQNAELVDALKNLFNSIDRNNAVSQGFWDQYHAAAQVLKSHTNRPKGN